MPDDRGCPMHGLHPHADRPPSRGWCTACQACMDEAVGVPVRSTSIDSVSRETSRVVGLLRYCPACGEPDPRLIDDVVFCGRCGWETRYVPVPSKNIDAASRETTAVFPAAGGCGHLALSEIPLPVAPVGDGL